MWSVGDYVWLGAIDDELFGKEERIFGKLNSLAIFLKKNYKKIELPKPKNVLTEISSKYKRE